MGVKVEERKEDELILVPNPTKGKVSLSGKAWERAESAFLLTASGQRIDLEISTQQNEIDLQKLTKGIYYLQLLDGKGTLICSKSLIKN